MKILIYVQAVTIKKAKEYEEPRLTSPRNEKRWVFN